VADPSELVVDFSASTQSLGALQEAAYRLIGQAACRIDEAEGRYICRLSPTQTRLEGDGLHTHFLDLVTDENLREKVNRETERLRDVIVALAFGSLAQEEWQLARFAAPTSFTPEASTLQLLPIRFERLGADRLLVGNMVGDLTEMTEAELDRLCSLDLVPGDGLYERAFEKLLVKSADQLSQQQLLALRLRSRLSFLRAATPLHLFVVTLRCEHSCPYCQVSRQSQDRQRYDDQDRVSRRRAAPQLRPNPVDCRGSKGKSGPLW
jgi:His-Xaa-Ser system protein HxsD